MKNIKNYHYKFIKYMKKIIVHKNYEGLPIKVSDDNNISWVCIDDDTKNKRIQWLRKKANSLGFNNNYEYADIMREIHPTKKHVCQICGSEMHIYYYYPSINLLKSINEKFSVNFDRNVKILDIFEIWDYLINLNNDENIVKNFFISKFELNSHYISKSKNDIINECEKQARTKRKKLLSPGVMSNFPDRFDGFHSYNICCRQKQDKGRAKSNLDSYSKDRRAYEYWNDGNTCAANKFMKSSFFKGFTADHIGPISLGFVHDPHYLRKMPQKENISKRDKLVFDDILIIMNIENKTNINAMSWYSLLIWNHIKEDCKQYINSNLKDKIAEKYRQVLKQNLVNFMSILNFIFDNVDKENYESFFTEMLILPKYNCYYKYEYKFDKYGKIIEKCHRKLDKNTNKELDRIKRIFFTSVKEHNSKYNSLSNRKIKNNITELETKNLHEICNKIKLGKEYYKQSWNDLKKFIDKIQNRLILELKNKN